VEKSEEIKIGRKAGTYHEGGLDGQVGEYDVRVREVAPGYEGPKREKGRPNELEQVGQGPSRLVVGDRGLSEARRHDIDDEVWGRWKLECGGQ
jgi:hypothetical protein